VITPFTAYQQWDGVFRSDGFGANLRDLTGAVVRTARRMGTAADSVRGDQHVRWLDGLSPVGVDGYCEYLDVAPGAEVMARFESPEPVLNGQPAATRRKIGKGSVIKLGFWPGDNSALKLFRGLVAEASPALAGPAPAGVQAVPRADRSLFVVNTSHKQAAIQLARGMTDRLTGRKLGGAVEMKGYEVLWLE
jgi:beta-galactosidase GanA